MLRSPRRGANVLVALVSIVLALVLSACGSSGNGSNASNVSCSKVSAALAAAQTQLTTDTANYNRVRSDGTPGQVDAKNAVDNDNSTIKALQARATSCGSSSDAVTASPSPTQVSSVDPSLLKALTIDAAAVSPCTKYVPTANVENGFVMPSLAFKTSVASGGRYSGDSLSTPVDGTTTQAQLMSVAYKVCSDPLVGYAYGNMLYNTKLGSTGKTIGDINPWLASAHADQPTSVALVSQALPNAGKVVQVSSEQATATVSTWGSYDLYAAKVVALLNVFNTVGIENNPQSVANWHFQNSGAVVGQFPVVVLNDHQENLPALVLALRNKGQSCEISRIGANLKDSRPEVFTPQGCAPTPSTTPTPGCSSSQSCGHTTTPGCTSNCATSPPGCSSSCHTSPPTPCVCVSKSAVSQPVPPAPKPTNNPPQAAPSPAPTSAQPIVTGTPVPVDTGTHGTPVPTPTGGPFG